VTLALHLAAGPARVGEPVAITVMVTNTGDRPVRVAGVVGGSETGLRYPHYLPLVRAGDTVVARPGPDEDPMVGPLRERDLVLLEPGAAFDPTGPGFQPLATFATFRPQAPGDLTFELTLDTSAPDPSGWFGSFGQDTERDAVLGALRSVPAVRLTAAVVVGVPGG
jgi:hypothetical protein